MVVAGTYALKYTYMNYYPPYWIVEPILMGIWSALCYLLLFGIIVMFTNEQKIITPKRSYFMNNEQMSWTDEEQELLNEIEINS